MKVFPKPSYDDSYPTPVTWVSRPVTILTHGNDSCENSLVIYNQQLSLACRSVTKTAFLRQIVKWKL